MQLFNIISVAREWQGISDHKATNEMGDWAVPRRGLRVPIEHGAGRNFRLFSESDCLNKLFKIDENSLRTGARLEASPFLIRVYMHGDLPPQECALRWISFTRPQKQGPSSRVNLPLRGGGTQGRKRHKPSRREGQDLVAKI